MFAGKEEGSLDGDADVFAGKEEGSLDGLVTTSCFKQPMGIATEFEIVVRM